MEKKEIVSRKIDDIQSESDTPLRIYTYRYMWKCLNSDKISFEFVTGTVERLNQFETSLLENVSDLERVAKEYISEIDCTKMCCVVPVYENSSSEVKK